MKCRRVGCRFDREGRTEAALIPQDMHHQWRFGQAFRPFEQPQRLISQTAPKIFAAVDMEQFVADCTRPGDGVMMIYPLGHRIAYDNGVYDSFPYDHPASVVTTRQVADLVHQLQANPVSAVFSEPLSPELVSALDGAGYRRVLERQPTIPAAKTAATGGDPPRALAPSERPVRVQMRPRWLRQQTFSFVLADLLSFPGTLESPTCAV